MLKLILAEPDDEVWSEPLESQQSAIKQSFAHAKDNPNKWVCVTSTKHYHEAKCFIEGNWPLHTKIDRQIVPDLENESYIIYVRYKHTPEKKVDPEKLDPNVKELCDIIATGAESNGYKVTDRYLFAWTKDAALVIERAAEIGRDPESVFTLARWALTHHFWSNNIRSVPKFHQQYDTLREQANKESKGSNWSQRRAKIDELWDGKDVSQSGVAQLWDLAEDDQ